MKFVFIAKHRSIWPVAWLCEALGVSRSVAKQTQFVAKKLDLIPPFALPAEPSHNGWRASCP
jgi:hypothetical protein